MRFRMMTVLLIGLAMAGVAVAALTADDVEMAIYGTGDGRQAAIARLRHAGPPGLDQLLARVATLDRQREASPHDEALLQARQALEDAIEQVGGARYCRQSQLYWYTDEAQALAAARAQGKPILALRLLGQLTDEYSCANSRFFRTTLYSNAEISRYLRENYILTWKSVRPVPTITIDFGDGRRLQRTLTGNSIHYVLTSEGEVVDALPGLYGPRAFLERLRQAESLTREVATLPVNDRTARLAAWHLRQASDSVQRWEADLVAVTATDGATTPLGPERPSVAASPAVAPSQVNRPLDAAAFLSQQLGSLARRTGDEHWKLLAVRHAADAELDSESREMIRAHRPVAAQAGRLAITKAIVEDPLLRTVRNLQHSIALDSIKNDYTFRPQIHLWLSAAAGATIHQLDALNERVYAELFLMPANDPWLGLAPPDVYTALPNNGVTVVRP